MKYILLLLVLLNLMAAIVCFEQLEGSKINEVSHIRMARQATRTHHVTRTYHVTRTFSVTRTVCSSLDAHLCSNGHF